MKYFAYGEKILSTQLYSLIPSALCLGTARVKGYKIFFHSKANGISGKCNIVPDPDCEVYGVLYEIPLQERALLDKSESLGYGMQEMPITVSLQDYPDCPIIAFTYIAHRENIFQDLVPYTWYKELLVQGAKEHQFPANYIRHLENFACTCDPNVIRDNQQKRQLSSST